MIGTCRCNMNYVYIYPFFNKLLSRVFILQEFSSIETESQGFPWIYIQKNMITTQRVAMLSRSYVSKYTRYLAQ